jgi:hypothetical protein
MINTVKLQQHCIECWQASPPSLEAALGIRAYLPIILCHRRVAILATARARAEQTYQRRQTAEVRDAVVVLQPGSQLTDLWAACAAELLFIPALSSAE